MNGKEKSAAERVNLIEGYKKIKWLNMESPVSWLSLWSGSWCTLIQSLCADKKTKTIMQSWAFKKQQMKKRLNKAYKKLSIKWHPDRNLDNVEVAKNKFVDISNAYETLIDPNKRREYNKGGVKAVQDYEQQQGQAHLKRDIFGRIIHEPDPSEVYEDFFSGTDVFQLTIDSMHSFYRRNQVWVVFFLQIESARKQKCERRVYVRINLF